jgi:ATP-binding protein involved in chromosome partitioning
MNIETLINTTLANTIDPLTKRSCLELGIKPTITLDSNSIDINLRAGFPCNSLKTSLIPKFSEALQQALPHYQLHVTLESFIQAHQTQLAGKGLRGIKNTIAVASGKGGVGKSTVTVNLASALVKQGARVGILDADIYGPSIPTMLGPVTPIQMSDERYLPAMAHGIQAMSIGYLTDAETALIWRGPMLAKALIQMLDLTQWDDLDYLFIDLPPGTGDIQLSLVQKIPLTAAIIVTTPQTVATMDAEKALSMFERTNIDVLGIVENMSQHTCSQCGHQDTLFGHGGAQKLSSSHNTLLLGQLPLDSRITQCSDQGLPISENNAEAPAIAFLKAAMLATVELTKRPLNYSSKFPPIVVE